MCTTEQNTTITEVFAETDKQEKKCPFFQTTEVIKLLTELNEKFDEKISTDEWKNKKYDEMHSRMLKYQDDIVVKTIDPLLKSLIRLIDLIGREEKQCYGKEQIPEELVLSMLDSIKEQIESVLFDYDIEEYSCDSEQVNTKEQKIFRAIATEDETLNNCVAEILEKGYKKQDKIFRIEKVNVYKYIKKEEN